ncbi:hypothetical protein NHX12_004622 [Muraenolepis orangiensis]|uniref:Coiled-coil domain-containing protein 39 n=1 Tax=Muraenolepis orangiensis TaxID=630683 RepID=A0A9Q0IES5_9TELE|nr:hypothetical protein NHX12_004622 [Muraenolepis orangiensis]
MPRCTLRKEEPGGRLWKHLKALSEREAGHLRQDLARVKSELGVLGEKRNSQENDMFKASQKLQELRSQLKWDQQTLDGWLEKSALTDEDIMTLVKYTQQDERRIKSLTLAVEKKTLEANQKRKALDNELTETRLTQIGLEKTAENFRQAHQERQEVLRQWQNAIKQMKKRDAEMQQCMLQLAEVKQEVWERSTAVIEKRYSLQTEEQKNRECEGRISRAERKASKLRQDHQEQVLERSRLQEELDSLKTTVDRTATDVESLRTKISSVKRDIQDKTVKLNMAQLHNAALEDKLSAVTRAALSVEERAAQFDQLLRDQEQATQELDMQLQHHREALVRQKQNLQALRTKETDLTARMLGSKAALSGLQGHIGKLDQELLKRQKIIYHQDLQIQQLESKVGRLQGQGNMKEKQAHMEKKQALKRRSAQLTRTLEEKTRTAQLLSAQLKELEVDIRCTRKEDERTGTKNRELTSNMEELQLFNDTADKELKKLRTTKQDAMVEGNILKLELRRRRDLLNNRADGVLSQEKRRLELQTAMREQEDEIRVHKEMLAKEVKIAQQERQELSVETHESLSRVDVMRTRYEVQTISMGMLEGEEDKSQAYYIVKAAQEKEELRRKGENLNAEIIKMETEIRAMDNTIQLVNSCNSSYRKSLHTVLESGPEHEEMARLKEELWAAEEEYRYKRMQTTELQEDIQGMNSTMEMLAQEEKVGHELMNENQSRSAQLKKELDSQNEKIVRATKQCSKLTREIRSANQSGGGQSFMERDMKLREMRDFNRTINRMLLEVKEDQPHLWPSIHQSLVQANLSLPSPSFTPATCQLAGSSARSRSSASSASSSSSRAPALCSPATRTVELGLGLSVTSSGLAVSPRPGSTNGSRSSRRSGRGKNP